MSIISVAMASLHPFLAAPSQIIDGEPNIAKLKVGEAIELRFESRGCFHNVGYIFRFTRPKEVIVEISQLNRIPLDAPSGSIRIGELNLSLKDVARLDALLDFYRTEAGGACTTEDVIVITTYRVGNIGTSERYVDRSTSTIENRRDLMHVFELVERLETRRTVKRGY